MQIKKKITALAAAVALAVTNAAGVCPALANLTGMSNTAITAEAASLVRACFPVNNGGKVAYVYGYSEAYGKNTFHKGIDIHYDKSKIKDQTIYAAIPGTVYKIYNDCPHWDSGINGCAHTNTWGNAVVVKGTDGYFYIYGHLKQNSMYVKVGQKVIASDPLAVIGSSGASTGTHLHFEVRKKWGDGSSTINVNKDQYFHYVNGLNDDGVYPIPKRIPDPTDDLVDGGIYVIHSKENKNSAIAALGTTKESNVKLAAIKETDTAQQWKAVETGNYWYFVNVKSGLYLNAYVDKISDAKNGTNLCLYTKTNDIETQQIKAQKYENNGDSYYKLTFYNSNFSVNAYGDSAAAGDNITLYSSNGDTTQQWVLKKVGPVECTEHEWVETKRVEATSEAEGSVLYTCKNCGATKTETIPKIIIEPTNPYPVVSYEVSGRQFRLKWTAVSGAEKYGIAAYQSGKWRVKVQFDKDTLTYTSPKMSKGTYRMVVCAKVNGEWDRSSLKSRAFTIEIK